MNQIISTITFYYLLLFLINSTNMILKETIPNNSKMDQMQIKESKESIIPTKSNQNKLKQKEQHKDKQWTKTSKYVFSFKDLALDNEVKNTTIDTFVDILIRKQTKDLKNSLKKEKIQECSKMQLKRQRKLHTNRESFIILKQFIWNMIINGDNSYSKIDYLIQKEITNLKLCKIRWILIPWLLVNVHHWILTVIDLVSLKITFLDSWKDLYKSVPFFEKNMIRFWTKSEIVQRNAFDLQERIEDSKENTIQFRTEQGTSILQRNEFDWGVFTMTNMYCLVNFIDNTCFFYHEEKLRKSLDIFLASKGSNLTLDKFLKNGVNNSTKFIDIQKEKEKISTIMNS